jgi:hypothetical protein
MRDHSRSSVAHLTEQVFALCIIASKLLWWFWVIDEDISQAVVLDVSWKNLQSITAQNREIGYPFVNRSCECLINSASEEG